MNFYSFEGKRIRVRELRGRAYIDPLDDSVCRVFRDKGGNFYVIERRVLLNFDEYWVSLSPKPVYRNELKRVPKQSVFNWCPLIDQVEHGCFVNGLEETQWERMIRPFRFTNKCSELQNELPNSS